MDSKENRILPERRQFTVVAYRVAENLSVVNCEMKLHLIFCMRIGGISERSWSCWSNGCFCHVYRWFNPIRKMELDTAKIDDLASVDLTEEQRWERGFLVDEAATSESSIISLQQLLRV